jgi:hypothetical protein
VLGGVYLATKDSKKEMLDKRRDRDLDMMGLSKTYGADIDKATNQTTKKKDKSPEEFEKSADELAKIFARSGKSYDEFVAHFEQRIGKDMPESATKAFKDTQTAIHNIGKIDRKKVMKDQSVDSEEKALQVKTGAGKSITQAAAERRMTILNDKSLNVDGRKSALDALNEATKRVIEQQQRLRKALAAIGQASGDSAAAFAAMGNVYAEESAKWVGLEDKLSAINALLGVNMTKLNQFYTSYQRGSDVVMSGKLAAISATTFSPSQAGEKRTYAELDQSKQTLAMTQERFSVESEQKALAHTESLRLIDEEIKKAENNEERKMALLKQRQGMEREYTKQQMADAERVAALVDSQIQKQMGQIASLNEKRHSLEMQRVDTSRESRFQQQDLQAKSLGTVDRDAMKQSQFREVLQSAYDALPKMPEKAMELAARAKQMAASAVTDIKAMKDELAGFQRSTADEAYQMKRDRVAKYSPVAAWQMDISRQQELKQREEEAASKGEYKQAEQLAAQRAEKAKSIASAPAGVDEVYASQLSEANVMDARQAQENYKKQQISIEEGKQAEAQRVAKEATDIQDKAIGDQLAATQNQVSALQTNTSALIELRNSLIGKQPGATGSDMQRLSAQSASMTGSLQVAASRNLNVPGYVSMGLPSVPSSAGASSGGSGTADTKWDTSATTIQTAASKFTDAANALFQASQAKTNITVNVQSNGSTTQVSP